MAEADIHEGEPGFDEFIDDALDALSARARDEGICLDCLSSRLVVELVAGLARSGIAPQDILAMVVDGLDAAEDDDNRDAERRSRKMH